MLCLSTFVTGPVIMAVLQVVSAAAMGCWLVGMVCRRLVSFTQRMLWCLQAWCEHTTVHPLSHRVRSAVASADHIYYQWPAWLPLAFVPAWLPTIHCPLQGVLLCGLSKSQLDAVHLGPAHAGGQHLAKELQLVALRSAGRDELSPLGGPWNPQLDGGEPGRWAGEEPTQ